MDVLRDFLEDIKRQRLAEGCLLGLLHLLISRHLEKADGTLIGNGMTWRDLAALLKRVRWEKKSVAELGLNPADLPPRNRERFWYSAIAQARVDSEEAARSAETLTGRLRKVGFIVGASPGAK
jgi:hypothetical protein